MVKRIIYISCFLFFSCKSMAQEKKFYKSVESCVNEKSKKYTLDTFNLYDYTYKIEKLLVDEKILSGKGKQSYNNLLKEISNATPENKKRFFNIYQKINNELYYFDSLMNPGVLSSIFECTKYSLNESDLRNSKKYLTYYRALEKLLESPLFNNLTLNENLINSTPDSGLNNIVLRSPMIAIIYSNLYYYYESDGDNSKWLIR